MHLHDFVGFQIFWFFELVLHASNFETFYVTPKEVGGYCIKYIQCLIELEIGNIL